MAYQSDNSRSNITLRFEKHEDPFLLNENIVNLDWPMHLIKRRQHPPLLLHLQFLIEGSVVGLPPVLI